MNNSARRSEFERPTPKNGLQPMNTLAVRCAVAILSKSRSDLGLVSRVKELLRGSRTGCQYR
jgi:hypothetical protein